jgi:MFS-type transporter involved in bile tolerance (Atg22 family)
MTVLVPATRGRGLGGLTRSGSSLEALAWAFYDFANTIFSFAIVSFAMSLWTIRFLGEGPGTFWFTLFVLLLVGFWILRSVPEGEPENEEVAMGALVADMSR